LQESDVPRGALMILVMVAMNERDREGQVLDAKSRR
jgi:hypothetical protein